MIHQNSYQTRRIVGRLQSGDDLIESLTSLCNQQEVFAAQVRLVGTVERLEIIRFDAASKDYVTVAQCEEPTDIVSLVGSVSQVGTQRVIRLDGMFSILGPLGLQLSGGQVRAAKAIECEFVIEVFEDLRLKRSVSKQTGRVVLDTIEVLAPTEAPAKNEPAPQAQPTRKISTPAQPAPKAPAAAPTQQITMPDAKPAKAASSKTSWGDVAQQSQEKKKPSRSKPEPKRASLSRSLAKEFDDGLEEDSSEWSDAEEMPEMKPGDWLEHPKLGRCRVMRVENEERLQIRLPRGRMSALRLDFFHVTYSGEENGKSLYTLRMRK